MERVWRGVVVGVVVLGGATVSAQFRTQDWQVVVAMPVYFPDGTVREATVDFGGSGANNTTYYFGGQPNLCQPAVWPGEAPSGVSDGWRVRVSTTRGVGNVQATVEWQRVRAGSVESAASTNAIELTLRPGDRIPLDYVRPPGTGGDPACRPVGAALEVRTTLPDARLTDPAQTDLWLVVRAPGSSREQTQHRSFRLQPGTQVDYLFDDVPVSTPEGSMGVTVRGLLQLLDVAGGRVRMRLNVARGVRVGESPVPNALVILKNWGSARMAGRTLVTTFHAAPGEVVGFTLPPFVNEPGDGYQLSLRVRVPMIK